MMNSHGPTMNEDDTTEETTYGRCDTCGAPCDADGCTVDRTHAIALD